MKYQKGMTLTEVLIVSTLLIALILLPMINLKSQTDKGLDARRKGETRRIGIAIEEYANDHNCYPLPNVINCYPGTGLQPYMEKIPCDPQTNASYFYDYDNSACPKWYKIYVKLGNIKDADFLNGVGPGSAFNYVYASSNAPADMPTGAVPGIPSINYYGCSGSSCVAKSWDRNRPGPVCDPYFLSSSCNGLCAGGGNQCSSWIH